MKKAQWFISLGLAAGLVCIAGLLMNAFPAMASNMSITPKYEKYYTHTGYVDQRNLAIAGDSLGIHPPAKGARVVDCKVEIATKHGFEVSWQNKSVMRFTGCQDLRGYEVHGEGVLSIHPINQPGNTGKIIYKFEILQ